MQLWHLKAEAYPEKQAPNTMDQFQVPGSRALSPTQPQHDTDMCVGVCMVSATLVDRATYAAFYETDRVDGMEQLLQTPKDQVQFWAFVSHGQQCAPSSQLGSVNNMHSFGVTTKGPCPSVCGDSVAGQTQWDTHISENKVRFTSLAQEKCSHPR